MDEVLDGHLFGADQPCFGCGPAHPIGFRLSFVREGDVMVTRFVPGEQYQGPPGIMHGGLVATLADETAVWAIVGLKGRFGFTGSFSARLKSPVRIGEEVVCRSHIESDRGRLVDVAVEVEQGEARCFEGTFCIAVLDTARVERLLQRPLPEEWRRFSRDFERA